MERDARSLVVAGRDLGNALEALGALRDVARAGGEYPVLFSLADAASVEEVPADYWIRVRGEALRAARELGPRLSPRTLAFLRRVELTK